MLGLYCIRFAWVCLISPIEFSASLKIICESPNGWKGLNGSGTVVNKFLSVRSWARTGDRKLSALPASCLLDSVQAAAVAVGTGLPEQPCTDSSKVMLGWGRRQLALSLCALQLPPALGMAQN